MLTGFVFGFGVKGKSLVLSRVEKSAAIKGFIVNASAVKASKLHETADEQRKRQQQAETARLQRQQKEAAEKKEKEAEEERKKAKTEADKNNQARQNNGYTQNGGRPITTVSRQAPVTSDTTRYHIYHNGKIKRENKAATGYAEFIYYDQQGNAHNLGKSAYIKASRRGANNVSVGGNVYLVDQRKHTHYKNGNIGYKWFIDPMNNRVGGPARRYYLNGLTMSGVLGTLMNLGYEEYVGTGWSNERGESVGSSSHRNGEAGDFRYLSKNGEHRTKVCWTSSDYFDLEKNTKWVAELKKFGFQTFYTQIAGTSRPRILGTTYWSGHVDHLHIGQQGDAVSLISRGILEEI